MKEADPMSRTSRQKIGQQLESVRAQLYALMEDAKEVAIADIAEGVPEALVARELSVARTTVRAWTQGENDERT